jgi:opacity protein-like surface antigen
MNSNHLRLASATALFVVSGCAAPVLAADLAPAPEIGEWHFAVAPYAWGAGIKGDVGLFGLEPVNLDIPFSDILQDLKFAGMGVVEAHNGKWGVFGDVIYTSLEADESVTRVVSVNDRPPVEAQLNASIGVQEFVGTLMGQWRALDNEQMTLDLMAGARLWYIDNEISMKLKLDGTKVGALSGSDGATWVDPMVGIKSRIETGSPLYFSGWGMIGGAGVGSDFTWDVMAGLGYQWTDRFATVLGYRAIGVDYDNDGFVYDVTQQGVILGGVFNF